MNTAAAGGNAALVAMEEWSSGVLSGKLTGLHASPPPPVQCLRSGGRRPHPGPGLRREGIRGSHRGALHGLPVWPAGFSSVCLAVLLVCLDKGCLRASLFAIVELAWICNPPNRDLAKSADGRGVGPQRRVLLQGLHAGRGRGHAEQPNIRVRRYSGRNIPYETAAEWRAYLPRRAQERTAPRRSIQSDPS